MTSSCRRLGEKRLLFVNSPVTPQKAILWYYNGVTQSPPAKDGALRKAFHPLFLSVYQRWVSRSIRCRWLG